MVCLNEPAMSKKFLQRILTLHRFAVQNSRRQGLQFNERHHCATAQGKTTVPGASTPLCRSPASADRDYLETVLTESETSWVISMAICTDLVTSSFSLLPLNRPEMTNAEKIWEEEVRRIRLASSVVT
jgi:hypothetical protein